MSTRIPAWLNDNEWRKQAEQLFEFLPENHRRWLAGLMSFQVGWGGIERMCELFGVSESTVRTGRKELRAGIGDRSPDRVRLPGGGRPTVEEVDPAAEKALLELVEVETAGDPCSSRKWTRRSARALARALKKKGHELSRETVRRLLKKTVTHSGPTASASRARGTRTGRRSSDT